ncbi:MAG: CDP-archaeol synthase [Desulfobulbus sp.]|nr:MAG: CDP-archaeol synthase [Desulfobulbus sp.]
MAIAFKITVFLLWINLLPPLAALVLGVRGNRPLDGGLRWLDGRPFLGPHKTIRGVLAGLAGGTAVYGLLGVSWQTAAIASLLAMAGDLLSSFGKRRVGLASGSIVPILDQIFECLLPALYLGQVMHLQPWQVLIVFLLFTPAAYLGSRFWTYLTSRPGEDYPRIIRSTVRLREWRSCHVPLARWQVLFNLSSFLSYQIFYTWIFKLAGLQEQGKRNALQVEVVETAFSFADLPASFDGFRILFLTDLHLDGLEGLTDRLIKQVRDLEVDLCLVGGDIRMNTYGPMAACLRRLRRLLAQVRSRHGIFGVLGNHDCIEMNPDFEESGMIMLVNDAWSISRNGSRIWLVGVDDPHYYRVDDAAHAFRTVPAGEFSLFLAHSPEAYESAARHGARLYLCGHTHGGQICLPGRGPVLTNSRAPRFTAVGTWRFREMIGYTSRGAGASGIPLRFNCPGEISLITLRRAPAS